MFNEIIYDILLVDCEDIVLVEVDKDLKGHVYVVAIFNIYIYIYIYIYISLNQYLHILDESLVIITFVEYELCRFINDIDTITFYISNITYL